MSRKLSRILQIAGIVLLVTVVIGTTSCKHESLLVHFNEGDCYVGKVDASDWVVRIDAVTDDDMRCRLYAAETAVADPQNISVKAKKKKWIVESSSFVKPLEVKPAVVGDRVRCDFKQLNEVTWFAPVVADTVQYWSQYVEPQYEVKVESDVKYGEAEGYWTSYPDEDISFAKMYFDRIGKLVSKKKLDLTMDIYQPVTNSDQKRPLIVFIHGGSFLNGDKADEAYRLWCSHFASLGYVAASINYRMGWSPSSTNIDAAGFRATQDANAAMRFLAHNAKKYHINPEWVFLAGSSAGAITALNVAFLNDDNKPASVAGEGPIDKLVPRNYEKFQIAAIVNMWGAVCDTTILADSRTAIISFHGDADKIIPYGCGYPFVSMLDKKKEEKPTGFFNSLISRVVPGSDDEIWDNLVSPMYGSSCIDKYYKDHGMHSELHTVRGAGHSMHVDAHRKIAPYFYTIQDSTALFLYDDMVVSPVHFERTGVTAYRIDDSNVSEVHWQARGGVVVESKRNHARMMFYGDEPIHKAIVTGKYKSGVEFREEIGVE